MQKYSEGECELVQWAQKILYEKVIITSIYHLAERLDRRFCKHRVPSSIPGAGIFLFFFLDKEDALLYFVVSILHFFLFFFIL